MAKGKQAVLEIGLTSKSGFRGSTTVFPLLEFVLHIPPILVGLIWIV